MTQVIINIPDGELDFFMKLIEKFNYKTIIPDLDLTPETKSMLDQRLAEDTSTYISAQILMEDIDKRYGL